jgi:hypothetical protein
VARDITEISCHFVVQSAATTAAVLTQRFAQLVIEVEPRAQCSAERTPIVGKATIRRVRRALQLL